MKHLHRGSAQRGVAAVEFAIVSALFFTVLIAVMEMGRLLWTWNAATEATRLGARLAVVCSLNDSIIRTRMQERLPVLTPENIKISYLPGGCTEASCRTVRVTLQNYTHDAIIPFLPMSLMLPSFSTSLPKEFMQSAGNAICN